MGGKKHTSKTLMEKSSVHPNSRHAFQRSRIALRKRRLDEAKGVRERARNAKVDRIMSFVLLLSEDKSHLPDLNSLHDFINTFYLGRHNLELETLRSEQRPGRPKSKRLLELEETAEKEKREYREGIEVPDLTNETNVTILREWQGDPQALHLFRFIRVSSVERDMCVVTQAGSHKLLQEPQ